LFIIRFIVNFYSISMSLHLNIFSESTKHAIQAMIYLSLHRDKPILVRTISEYYSIPLFYLAKIIQILVKHNLVISTKGRGGGVRLKKSPKKIFVSNVVEAIEGKNIGKEQCVYGLDVCSDSVPCPIHKTWKKLKPEIVDVLINQNFETLSNDLIEKHDVLSNDKSKK